MSKRKIISITIMIIIFPIVYSILIDPIPQFTAISIVSDKTQYEIGEEVSITMTNTGLSTLKSPYPIRIVIQDEYGNNVFGCSNVTASVHDDLYPGQLVSKTWDQKECVWNSEQGIEIIEQVKPGKYIARPPFIAPYKMEPVPYAEFEIISS